MRTRWQIIVAIVIIVVLLLSSTLVGCGEKEREELPTPSDSLQMGTPLTLHGSFGPGTDIPVAHQAAIEGV